jgi:hypothetical protein
MFSGFRHKVFGNVRKGPFSAAILHPRIRLWRHRRNGFRRAHLAALLGVYSPSRMETGPMGSCEVRDIMDITCEEKQGTLEGGCTLG